MLDIKFVRTNPDAVKENWEDLKIRKKNSIYAKTEFLRILNQFKTVKLQIIQSLARKKNRFFPLLLSAHMPLPTPFQVPQAASSLLL